MALPGTIAGAIGRFNSGEYTLEDYSAEYTGRVLDVDGAQEDFGPGSTATVEGRACSVVEENQQVVHVDGTNITILTEETTVDFATEWAARGRIVMAERAYEDGGGHFPFTLMSSVSNVKCDRLCFDTEAIRKAWEDDGTLSDTWMAGHRDVSGDATTMAYGEASEGQAADIGLGFERSWEGYLLQGVVYATGYVAVYEDEIGRNGFLRFVEDTLVPHSFVPEDEDDFLQRTFDDEVEEYLEDEGHDVERDPDA